MVRKPQDKPQSAITRCQYPETVEKVPGTVRDQDRELCGRCAEIEAVSSQRIFQGEQQPSSLGPAELILERS